MSRHTAPTKDTAPTDGSAGTVVAVFGRHYEILMADGSVRTGYPRGKKSHYACGDAVSLTTDGQLLGFEPRQSLLYRSDAFREKLLAANATQLILVTATEPSFSDALLSRALVAAEAESMRAVIVLNKSDCTALLPAARQLLAPFAQLGYPIIELSALSGDLRVLHSHLAGQTSVLVGQSGMGKSTLTNALIPGTAAATREISSALDSGKHTTTCTRLYQLPGGGALIDSPGLQEFGLAHLDRLYIESGFREFRPLRGECRYRDCAHRTEPGCALQAAVTSGAIHPRRLEHFHSLLTQLEAQPRY
jgi:ribosome biogenesis GTPase / thiamine phosphate phosphatase